MLKRALNNAITPDATQRFAINGARISQNDPLTVLFDTPQVITNGERQKDGTFYDIPTLDINSRWNGKLMDDHEYGWSNRLGTVIGAQKDAASNSVTIAGVKFSRANPKSQLAMDMMLEGLVEFSTGTLGLTEDDGARRNHEVYELSLVGVGNNDAAAMNDADLLTTAAKNGIDLSKYNLNKGTTPMKKFKVYNVNSFAVKLKHKNDAGQEQEVEVPANSSADLESATPQEEVQAQLDSAQAPVAPTDGEGNPQPAPAPAPSPAPGEQGGGAATNGVTPEAFAALTNAFEALKTSMNTPVTAQPGTVDDKRNLGNESMKDKVKNMTPGQRLYKQIMLERNGAGSGKNSDEYRAINEFNADQLVSKGLFSDEMATNAMDDSAGSLGGLIPPYELLDKIAQCETNYDAFLNAFGFNDAGLSYGWNVGIGDIDFQPTGYCAPSAQDGLEVGLQNRTQERLATHSVICNKVSRFSPVNVINFVASRYQQAYKRALVAFALAEMQVAVDMRVTGWNRASGTDVAADPTGSVDYPAAGQQDQIRAAVGIFTALSDCVQGGTYVMNAQTAAKLILDFNLAGQGDTQANGGTTRVNNYGALGVALGGTVVIVPNNMLPTLGTNGTVTVARSTEGGGNVTIDHAVFYTSTDNWYGVTNGALQFDVDSFGSYEVTVSKTVTGGGGGTVSVTETRSAKQRGETVLFGEMYRGGGIFDFRSIGGIKAALLSES